MRCVLILSIFALVAAAPIVDNGKSEFHSIEYDHFWTYDEIIDWMHHINEEYPDNTEIFQMGRTAQGRDIIGIRITSEQHLAQETLPVIFVTAATSARDWITAMSAVNLIHMLAEYRHFYADIVDDLDWYIIPIANPDGYVFSMTDGNRDWVKNRVVNPGSTCFGVNIERNFDFNWDSDIDSSSDPCSDNFRGPSADSEEETKTIQFTVDITRRIQLAYISLKAGQPDTFNGLITYPYAFSSEAMPPNWDETQNVAFSMSNNVRDRTGARFSTGTYSNILRPTAGTSMDYAAGADQIPLAYTIFTPPSGRFGWDVETWRINPVVDQIFFAMENLARYVLTMPFNEGK